MKWTVAKFLARGWPLSASLPSPCRDVLSGRGMSRHVGPGGSGLYQQPTCWSTWPPFSPSCYLHNTLHCIQMRLCCEMNPTNEVFFLPDWALLRRFSVKKSKKEGTDYLENGKTQLGFSQINCELYHGDGGKLWEWTVVANGETVSTVTRWPGPIRCQWSKKARGEDERVWMCENNRLG